MSESTNIRLLSDHVINKIAAGEVVERPASALKELMENALDAGATQVDVTLIAGGRTLVQVADNGAGMSRDDALLAIERHATSKIREVDDIERIATLGFRGEALAAISAVSRFTLCTRRAADLGGTEVVLAGGKLQDVRAAGCPPGTTVAVRHLFFNVPARRKFLRADATELAHLRQIFLAYALAHPALGFSLTVDGRALHTLPGQATLEERLRDLFPSVPAPLLRRVDYTAGALAVSGYAGLPETGRSDRGEQYLFVNRRPAGAAPLAAAIREGYHTLLPRDRHPVLFLFLTLDPTAVDVNVHPTKKEVRFREPGAVRAALSEALRTALAQPPAAPGAGALRRPPLSPAAAAAAGTPVLSEWRGPLAGDRAPGPPYPHFTDAASAAPRQAGAVPPDAPPPAAASEHVGPGAAAPWTWFRVLGQVGGLYVVMEVEDGLVLMDPHAAHERVLYERWLAEARRGATASHGLLLAETVELAPRDAARLRQALDALKQLGFGVAAFGGDAFVIDALPACLSHAAPRALVLDVLAELEALGPQAGARALLEERIMQAACRSAVKAMDRLAPAEIESLVAQLGRTEMPYTCPHGRPTLIHISWSEWAKKFGRT